MVLALELCGGAADVGFEDRGQVLLVMKTALLGNFTERQLGGK